MRIAIWHNLPSGGGKRQLFNHVQGLLERGHHLEAWCPDSADRSFLPLGALIREHVVPLRGPKALYRDPRRPPRATRQLIASLEEQCRRCAEEISAGDFDVLFGNACQYLRASPIAAFVNLPSAICLHEPFRWFYEAMPELPWIAPAASRGSRGWRQRLRSQFTDRTQLASARLQARAELDYARAFDVVLANSIFSREALLRAYNVEAKVCYLGVDTDYYRPTGEGKERFVVGVGTIYHAKGIDRAIRALSTIPPARRPPLVWIGNGALESEMGEYRRLAERLQVDFTARIDIADTEVISVLSRAMAMLYTSRLEPFGFAPLEANACGTAVVGIAEGGVKETVRDGINGFLAAEDDPRHLGELVSRLVDDSEFAAHMGRQGRDHVIREWNISRSTDNIESRLSTLLDEKRAKTLLGSPRRLRELQPTNNLRINVEHRAVRNGRLEFSGWAHINDGRDATGSEIFILLRNDAGVELFRATTVMRTDVTEYFRDGHDYDTSGFVAAGEIRLSQPYRIGILITRSTDVALQFL